MHNPEKLIISALLEFLQFGRTWDVVPGWQSSIAPSNAAKPKDSHKELLVSNPYSQPHMQLAQESSLGTARAQSQAPITGYQSCTHPPSWSKAYEQPSQEPSSGTSQLHLHHSPSPSTPSQNLSTWGADPQWGQDFLTRGLGGLLPWECKYSIALATSRAMDRVVFMGSDPGSFWWRKARRDPPGMYSMTTQHSGGFQEAATKCTMLGWCWSWDKQWTSWMNWRSSLVASLQVPTWRSFTATVWSL